MNTTNNNNDNNVDSDQDADAETFDITMSIPPVPSLFSTLPPLRDELKTASSIAQDATIAECLPFLALKHADAADINAYGVPRLQRERHVRFLKHALGNYPADWVALDSSRPWVLYWALAGLYMLGEDVSRYRDRWVWIVFFLLLRCWRNAWLEYGSFLLI
jgi:protein farnesyltransferase subunit beta